MTASTLRIGTWNLAGRWSDDHAELIARADCDVWLLTEVVENVSVDGFALHLSEGAMAPRRRWAAVMARHDIVGLPDPHPASALAVVDGIAFCSSILPWRTCGQDHPWVGETHGEKTTAAVADLVVALEPLTPLVWGGDWNSALTGPEYAGSVVGRTAIQQALNDLHLQALTADLPHHLEGATSIDHLAVGPGITGRTAERIVAEAHGKRLSDHDLYVADVEVQRQ